MRCFRKSNVDPTHGIEIGTVFQFDQFISTSVVETRTLDGTYSFVIMAPKGTCGAYIEEVSAYPSQREFLLDKSCKFRLISRKGNEIMLEVVV